MKKKRKSSVLIRLFVDMGRQRKSLYFVVFVIALSKFFLAIAPRIGGKLTDQIVAYARQGQYDIPHVIRMCVVLAILYLLGNGAEILIGTKMMAVSQSLIKKLRDRGFAKFNRLPISYIDSHPTGDIVSRMTNDLQSLTTALESTLSVLIGQIILLVGVIIMMLITNPLLTLIYFIVLPLGFLASGGIVATCVKHVRKQSKFTGALSAIAIDSYSNYPIIKAYQCEDSKIKAFNVTNRNFYRQYVKAQFLTGFIMPISVITSNVAYILECIIGGLFLIRGTLTLGEFQAFLLYGNMVLAPLTALSTAVNSIQTGLVAAERVYEFLDEPEESDEKDKAEINFDNFHGNIEFSKVKFGYSKDKILMNDISFETRAGQTIAIVGPTGAGKTTLINLLLRFYDINDGQILMDSVSINDYSRNSLRKAYGIVLQDSWIFEGTIAENISYGKPDATREEIIETAKRAYCDEFISRLPNGYDTVISDEKSGLSSGEKQLLSIARTMMANPRILILDEATSQVDTKTELVITNAMTELMSGRTCFVIAHRLFTIKNADKIIYMEDGDIKEVGSHIDLMNMNGKYATLYRSAAEV